MSENEAERFKRRMFDEMQIGDELAQEAVEQLATEGSVYVGTDRFTVDEADDPDGPLTLTRDRDGARFEVKYEVTAFALTEASS